MINGLGQFTVNLRCVRGRRYLAWLCALLSNITPLKWETVLLSEVHRRKQVKGKSGGNGDRRPPEPLHRPKKTLGAGTFGVPPQVPL